MDFDTQAKLMTMRSKKRSDVQAFVKAVDDHRALLEKLKGSNMADSQKETFALKLLHKNVVGVLISVYPFFEENSIFDETEWIINTKTEDDLAFANFKIIAETFIEHLQMISAMYMDFFNLHFPIRFIGIYIDIGSTVRSLFNLFLDKDLTEGLFSAMKRNHGDLEDKKSQAIFKLHYENPPEVSYVTVGIPHNLSKLASVMDIKEQQHLAVGISVTRDLFYKSINRAEIRLTPSEKKRILKKGRFILDSLKIEDGLIESALQISEDDDYFRDLVDEFAIYYHEAFDPAYDGKRKYLKKGTSEERIKELLGDAKANLMKASDPTFFSTYKERFDQIPDDLIENVKVYCEKEDISPLLVGISMELQERFEDIIYNGWTDKNVGFIDFLIDFGEEWMDVLKINSFYSNLIDKSDNIGSQSLTILEFDDFQAELFDPNPLCFQETLNEAVNNDGSLWTIGFQYASKYSSVHYQIGMTGTCKKNETMYSALKRELYEELGVEIIQKPNTFRFICEDARGTHEQDWLVCVLSANNLNPITSIQKPKAMRDDRSQKVGAIIVGSRKEIIDLIRSSIENWPEVGKSDDIRSIVAMPLEFIWNAPANRPVIEMMKLTIKESGSSSF